MIRLRMPMCVLALAFVTSFPILASAQGFIPPRGVTGAAVDPTANYDWTGTNTFIDSLFFIKDNIDPTRRATFQLSGISSGQTRTYTLPDWSSVLASLNQPQSFDYTQTFTAVATLGQGAYIPPNYGTIFGDPGSFGTVGTISTSSFQTPVAPMLLTGTVSNSWIISPSANRFFAHGHAAQLNPTLYIHDGTASTNRWVSLSHDGTDGVITTGAGGLTVQTGGPSAGKLTFGNGYTFIERSDGISTARLTINSFYGSPTAGVLIKTGGGQNPRQYYPGTPNTLVDATPSNVVEINLSSADAGAGGVITYTITANSGGTWQSRSGIVSFTIVNQASVESCVFGAAVDAVTPTGTLTVSWDCDTSLANTVKIRANVDTSLNVAPVIHWQMVLNGSVSGFTQPF